MAIVVNPSIPWHVWQATSAFRFPACISSADNWADPRQDSATHRYEMPIRINRILLGKKFHTPARKSFRPLLNRLLSIMPYRSITSKPGTSGPRYSNQQLPDIADPGFLDLDATASQDQGLASNKSKRWCRHPSAPLGLQINFRRKCGTPHQPCRQRPGWTHPHIAAHQPGGRNILHWAATTLRQMEPFPSHCLLHPEKSP